MKRLLNWITGFHNLNVITDLSQPPVIHTVNPDYLDMPKETASAQDMLLRRDIYEKGALTRAEIIKDTFGKNMWYMSREEFGPSFGQERYAYHGNGMGEYVVYKK